MKRTLGEFAVASLELHDVKERNDIVFIRDTTWSDVRASFLECSVVVVVVVVRRGQIK